MKVKIFTENTETELIEKKINAWIEKNNPDIKFIKQSESIEGHSPSFNLTISIWYEDQKK